MKQTNYLYTCFYSLCHSLLTTTSHLQQLLGAFRSYFVCSPAPLWRYCCCCDYYHLIYAYLLFFVTFSVILIIITIIITLPVRILLVVIIDYILLTFSNVYLQIVLSCSQFNALRLEQIINAYSWQSMFRCTIVNMCEWRCVHVHCVCLHSFPFSIMAIWLVSWANLPYKHM